jgi:hypothetical protein
MSNKNTERYQQALWYAWGQQDAGIGANVDAFDFAQHYTVLGGALDAGASSFLPSVQDAWKQFLAAATERLIKDIPAVSDEVRDMLAKSIDEAQPTGYVEPVHPPRAENQRPTS